MNMNHANEPRIRLAACRAAEARVERLRAEINGALTDIGDGLEDAAYTRLKDALKDTAPA